MMLIDVIGSRKRLMILKMLSRGEKCVSEIIRELKMDGKTAKYHLDILENHGLIETRMEGKRKYYRLKKEIRLKISLPPYRKFILSVVEKKS